MKKTKVIIGVIVLLLVLEIVFILIINPIIKKNNTDKNLNPIDAAIEMLKEENNFYFNRISSPIENNEDIPRGYMPNYIVINDIFYHNSGCFVEKGYIMESMNFDNDNVKEVFVDKNIENDSISNKVYYIKYMSSDIAVALEDEYTNKFYVYVQDEYKFESLEKFLNDTGFYYATKNVYVYMSLSQENSIITYINDDYNYLEYLYDSIAKITDTTTLDNKENVELSGLSISYRMDHIESIVSIEFGTNGEIFLDCFGPITKQFFDTDGQGIEFATELIEYLGENCKGYYYSWD